MDDKIDAEQIAQICHEANRAYCQTIGDNSQPTWDKAPAWQRESAIDGVNFHLAGLLQGERPNPAASHENWLKEKTAAGWTYGPEKKPELKQHPCFVPYEELPVAQKMKDYVFCSIVEAFYNAQQAHTGVAA